MKNQKNLKVFVDDLKYDSQFKLGKKELYKAMPGDLVQFSLTQKDGQKFRRSFPQTHQSLLERSLREANDSIPRPLATKMILRLLFAKQQ